MTNAVSFLEDRFITDREWCEKTGQHPKTPGILRSRGEMPIPYIRIGRNIRYRLSDVEAYLAARTVMPKSAHA